MSLSCLLVSLPSLPTGQQEVPTPRLDNILSGPSLSVRESTFR
jgi:hypothetical protein